jgi:hypothetical protein
MLSASRRVIREQQAPNESPSLRSELDALTGPMVLDERVDEPLRSVCRAEASPAYVRISLPCPWHYNDLLMESYGESCAFLLYLCSFLLSMACGLCVRPRQRKAEPVC